MLIVDSLLVSGVKFVLTRLVEAVEAEMYDETHLREELLAAQMRLELGEITDEDFEAIEKQVFVGLREIAERKKGARPAPEGGKLAVDSVSVDFAHDESPRER